MSQDNQKPDQNGEPKPETSGHEPYDPRPVSDTELREEYSREEVERWRQEADEHHSAWFSVMENAYGRD